MYLLYFDNNRSNIVKVELTLINETTYAGVSDSSFGYCIVAVKGDIHVDNLYE
jgi:hypothetical protein